MINVIDKLDAAIVWLGFPAALDTGQTSISHMSRLASFRGPSTPSASPVQHRQPNSPASQSKATESTFHRKIKVYLLELRSITETWDDLVLLDGLKSIKSLVDTRTDLEYVTVGTMGHTDSRPRRNALALIPGRQPRTHIVGPKLALIEKHLSELDAVLRKLVRWEF